MAGRGIQEMLLCGPDELQTHDTDDEHEERDEDVYGSCDDEPILTKSFVVALHKSNKRLREQVHKLSNRLDELEKRSVELVNTSPTTSICLTTLAADELKRRVRGLKLQQILILDSGGPKDVSCLNFLPTQWKYTYKGTFGFPHYSEDDKTSGKRTYSIRGDKGVSIRFKLVNVREDSLANETEIVPDGMLPFQMAFYYADNRTTKVKKSDLQTAVPISLTTPEFELVHRRQMVNGEVDFSWRSTNFMSTDTVPKKREFVIRVAPDLPELACFPELTATTPPFSVVSKKVFKKEA